MKSVSITKVVEISAAHRQFRDPSNCGFLHGHNWRVILKLTGPIGPLGYIVDFKNIKNVIEHLDHKVVLHEDDPLCAILIDAKQHVYAIPMNPTCENIALHLCKMIEDVFPETMAEVVVYENTNASAEAKNESN